MPTERVRKPTTIRRSLVSNIVALVALIGGGILLVIWVVAERTVDDLARLVSEPTVDRVSAQLDRFFGGVGSHVLVAKGWADRGTLDPTDFESLNALFVPILDEYPQISSMMVADSNGVEFLLLRDPLNPDIWFNRVVRADEWGTRVFNRRWDRSTGEVEEGFRELDYDPRRRIWYQEALLTDEASPVSWSEPVIFFTTKDPGITASTHVRTSGPTGGEPSEALVIAFDLLLLDISRFTSQLDITQNGRAVVLIEREGTEGLQVIGLPADERYGDDRALRDALIFAPAGSATPDADARLPLPSELDAEEIERAVRLWEEQGRPDESFSFSAGGAPWLAGFNPYPVGRNTLWIGVILPESDLLGGLKAQRAASLALIAVILIFGVVRSVALARRFSRPIEALVLGTERMRSGDLETSEPITTAVREYRRLADAQESMREALKDRVRLEKIERDLDLAREIQRGLLPVDAPDTPGFVVEGWSQAADQTGGDYFDWMTLPSGRTLIVLADATGHGIGPALIISVCRAYMRAAALEPDVALSQAVARVNNLLCSDLPDGRFITAAIGVLDPERSELSFLSAGQGPVLFRHATTGEIENSPADTVPLGIAPGVAFDAARRIRFEPGDALILTTDGFFEWSNPNGEQFGVTRLETVVAESVRRTPREFIHTLHAAVLKHADGEPQADDLTAVVIQREIGEAVE